MSPHFSGPTDDLTLLNSSTIQIIADSGQKRFFVHSEILAANAEKLYLVGGASGRIDLSCWDSDTVGRFVQFLYAKNYQAPPQPAPEEEDDDEGEEVDDVRRGGVDTPDTVQSMAEVEAVTKETNLLLIHAKLYALALERDVEALRAMALDRLKTALEGIDVRTLRNSSKASANIIDLLEYVYNRKSPKDETRDLVSNFAAGNVEKLMGRRGVKLVLGKGGDLGVELMAKLSGRLCDMGEELQNRKDQAAASEEKIRQLEEKARQAEEKINQSGNQIKQLEEKSKQSGEQVKKLEEKSKQSGDQIKKLEEKSKQSEDKAAKAEAKAKELDEKLKGVEKKLNEVAGKVK